jgi:putative addiction module antidote
MNQTVTVEMIDGELGVVFPDEVVKKLNLAEGDTLRVVEEAYGLVLRRPDAVSDGAVGAYRRGAEKYRAALRELAE